MLKGLSKYRGETPETDWTLLFAHDARNDQWIKISTDADGVVHFDNLGNSKKCAHLKATYIDANEMGLMLDHSVQDHFGKPLLSVISEYFYSVKDKIEIGLPTPSSSRMSFASENPGHMEMEKNYMEYVVEAVTTGQSVVPYQKVAMMQHYQLNANLLEAISGTHIPPEQAAKTNFAAYYVLFVGKDEVTSTPGPAQFGNRKAWEGEVEAIVLGRGKDGQLEQKASYTMSSHRFHHELPYMVAQATPCDPVPAKTSQVQR
ncbi:MAG: hypothetical protein IT567_04025 [Alphaproteobacteria bacterium]|nr:hypothetical protein [Alphaproteobacteria bacterium]